VVCLHFLNDPKGKLISQFKFVNTSFFFIDELTSLKKERAELRYGNMGTVPAVPMLKM
jgi:hypothetical protein